MVDRTVPTIFDALSAHLSFIHVQGEKILGESQKYQKKLQKIYSDFELHGIDEEQLNSKTYQSIQRHLQLEETNSALNDSASRIHHSSGPGRGLGGLTNQLG
jgi:hypothetical protein